MDEKLSPLLQEVGFTEKEALVYLSLMELGSGTVTDIAKRAKLKRSIIYILLEGLIKRGYVSEIPDTKINRYVAAEPTKILSDLKNKTTNFKSLLPSLLAVYNKTTWKPKINYFEGKEGVRNIYRYIENVKEAYFITSTERVAEHLPEEVEDWVTGKLAKTVPLIGKHLLSNTKIDRDFAKRLKDTKQQIKFLPKNLTLDMDVSIYENKVALTSLGDHLFIVVIESKELYNSMKTIFDLLWLQGVK
jgi:HTH-type transcriptional regulator, sugar sensing transcriptional regulator